MRLKYQFEIMELNDQIIAVPIGEEASQFKGVVQLNETGAAIFRFLEEGLTEEQIVEALFREYDCPREQLASDVNKILTGFVDKGLVTL